MPPSPRWLDESQRPLAAARRGARLAAAALAAALAVAACSPLVRYGDIEPPPGRETLVEVRVNPIDRERPDPDVVAASGHWDMSELLLEPAPKVSASTVESEMAAQIQGLDASAADAAIDLGELGTDARRVEAMYAARGYFRAHTVDWKIVSRGHGTARLELRVKEGPPTHVKEVVFAGITPSPDDEAMNRRLRAIEKELPALVLIAKGDVWTEELYLRSLDLVQRTFREHGFIHATVTGDNWVSREKHLAAVWFSIEHGPLVRAEGAPVIVGQHNIPKRRIRARVGIEDGDILEAKLLRDTEQRVSELGPFFSVQARPLRSAGRLGTTASEVPPVVTPAPEAEPVPPPDGPDGSDVLETEPAEVLPARVPVEVQLQEAALWDVSIGPAALTDSSKLEFALPVTFTHRNLFNQVLALRASVKPGLVFPDFWKGTACCATYDWSMLGRFGFEVPSFFEEFTRLSLEFQYERDPSQETTKEELGGRVSLSRRVATNLLARIGYEVSQVHYFGGDALENISKEQALRVADLRFRNNDFVAWLGTTFLYDSRDGFFDARHGVFGELKVDYGDNWTGSDIQFLRSSLELRGYLTLADLPWFTLAARAKVGGNWFPAGEGTPESVRFKAGGPNSHRGFNTDRMGDYVCGNKFEAHDPLAAFNDPRCGDAATDRVYIGGNYVVEGNIELRFQPGAVGVTVFVDFGRLWSRAEDINLGELFAAVGPGFRYATPVGILRADVGLLLGRNRDTVVHLSLGQAF